MKVVEVEFAISNSKYIVNHGIIHLEITNPDWKPVVKDLTFHTHSHFHIHIKCKMCNLKTLFVGTGQLDIVMS